MIILGKESRVEHLIRELENMKMYNALIALNSMLNIMNADNGYKRSDGSHYYYHLVDSTQDLINNGIKDEATLTACILHDFVEDVSWANFEIIEDFYGIEVADIVRLVTKSKDIDYMNEYNLQQYLNKILTNVKACLVKTADRKHNFSTLGTMSSSHEIRKANETEKFFIPFFKRARKLYPEYSAYFHSAKTTIMPHLKRIQKAHEDERKYKERIKELEMKLEQERLRNNALENKIRKITRGEL